MQVDLKSVLSLPFLKLPCDINVQSKFLSRTLKKYLCIIYVEMVFTSG